LSVYYFPLWRPLLFSWPWSPRRSHRYVYHLAMSSCFRNKDYPFWHLKEAAAMQSPQCDSDFTHQNSIAYEILWHVIIIFYNSINLDKNFIVVYIFFNVLQTRICIKNGEINFKEWAVSWVCQVSWTIYYVIINEIIDQFNNELLSILNHR